MRDMKANEGRVENVANTMTKLNATRLVSFMFLLSKIGFRNLVNLINPVQSFP